MVTYPFLSTGLFLTKRTMERVRMTTCDRCSRRLSRLVLNLIVYFGSHGILAWITSNYCASGTSHCFLGLKSNRQVKPDGQGNRVIRDVGSPQTALQTHLKGFGWVISDRVEAGDEEVRFFIRNKEFKLDQAQVQ